MKFIREELEPADILAGRNIDPDAKFAPAIRAILGSYTNHNGLFVLNQDSRIAPIGDMVIGDTTPPESGPVPLSKYEKLVSEGRYIVRVFRVKAMSEAERLKVAAQWWVRCNGIPYPQKSVMRLWTMRIVNSLPYEIPGKWCTKNTLIPFCYVLPRDRDPRRDPDGKIKLNPTPRTLENRLVSGVLVDVTDEVTFNG